MARPIVVWGAGAIGGIMGAHLVRAGQDILFVDAAEEHVEEMNRSGLVIEGPLGGFSVPVQASLPGAVTGPIEMVLLAVKSQHTTAACQALLPHLVKDGYVVSCQNGLNEPVIADIVGRARTIGAFVNFAGDYLGPGRITYGLRGTVAAGELDGAVTPRVQALGALLARFEPRVLISPNIMGLLWGKTSYAAILTASALTHDTIADFIADRSRRHLIRCLAQEVLDVAVKDGVSPLGFDTFEPSSFIQRDTDGIEASLDELAEFNRGTGKTHSGIWRDLAVRKRKTEVAAQFGPVSVAARQHGMAIPLLARLVTLIEAVEAGKREQGSPLADELCSLASATYA